MRVDPGELNKRIEIITWYERMENGYPIKREEIIRSCHAKMTGESGTELIKSGREAGEAKARFLVRTTNVPLTRDMKIRYHSDVYDIEYLRQYDEGYTEIVGTRRD